MTHYENIKHMSREQMAMMLAMVFVSGCDEASKEILEDAFAEYLLFLDKEMELTI